MSILADETPQELQQTLMAIPGHGLRLALERHPTLTPVLERRSKAGLEILEHNFLNQKTQSFSTDGAHTVSVFPQQGH